MGRKTPTTPGLALTTADENDPDEEHSSRSAWNVQEFLCSYTTMHKETLKA